MPVSIILNSEGEEYEWEYLHDQECSSAKWLKNCAEKNNKIYATDRFGMRKLASQAIIMSLMTDLVVQPIGQTTQICSLGRK
jgi:hypothetical protein